MRVQAKQSPVLVLALAAVAMAACDRPTPTRAPTGPTPEVTGGPTSAATPAATEDSTTSTSIDTDGDALPDVWETTGYDYDGDGRVDWDLAALGASPDHKDVFVEIDWMEPADASHTHAPREEDGDGVLTRAVQMFARAPVENPDGTTGINLHLEVGNAMPEITPLGARIGSSYDWTAFEQLKDQNFEPSKRAIWHYVIFAHHYAGTTSSGISRGIPASDLLVTLGSFTNRVGTVDEQTGTFVHELGHNLGLTHGGIGHVNFKPNYLSVMNYLYQMTGLRRAPDEDPANAVWGDFDYSRWDAPALDEAALDEPAGLGEGYERYAAIHSCACGQLRSEFPASGAIDWDCDDAVESATVDIDINCDSSLSMLSIQANWANIRFNGGLIGSGLGIDPSEGVDNDEWNQPMTTMADELTVELYLEIRADLEANAGLPPIGRQPGGKTVESLPQDQLRIYSQSAPGGEILSLEEVAPQLEPQP